MTKRLLKGIRTKELQKKKGKVVYSSSNSNTTIGDLVGDLTAKLEDTDKADG